MALTRGVLTLVVRSATGLRRCSNGSSTNLQSEIKESNVFCNLFSAGIKLLDTDIDELKKTLKHKAIDIDIDNLVSSLSSSTRLESITIWIELCIIWYLWFPVGHTHMGEDLALGIRPHNQFSDIVMQLG